MTGDAALERLREQKYDLVLLDMNMPGLTGISTCREIRRTSDIAIIMLTVRDSPNDKVDALDAGADDYVTKPFSTPELLARIRAAFRRLSGRSENGLPMIQLGEVEINMQTRRVRTGNSEVRLTPKEFDLLQYFMAHPNVPIAHTKLLQAVWGPITVRRSSICEFLSTSCGRKSKATPRNRNTC